MKRNAVEFLKKILPQNIKRSIFHLEFNLAPERFFEFAFKYASAPNMELGLKQAKALGLDCREILDIGGYHGDWSRMAHTIWPQSRITIVEANRQKKEILQKVANEIDADLIIEVLGAEDGAEVEFNLMESGSSVFEENSPLQRTKEKRHVRTLDSMFPDQKFDLIKIDVQGYEIEVLKGAHKVLANCKSLILEVSLIEINESCPLISEVLAFMSDCGFTTYEILEIHRRPLDRAMNQIDVLFIRKNSALIENKSHCGTRAE